MNTELNTKLNVDVEAFKEFYRQLYGTEYPYPLNPDRAFVARYFKSAILHEECASMFMPECDCYAIIPVRFITLQEKQ